MVFPKYNNCNQGRVSMAHYTFVSQRRKNIQGEQLNWYPPKFVMQTNIFFSVMMCFDVPSVQKKC